MVFVTENKWDFVDDGKLHPDLRSDLRDKGIDEGRLHLYLSRADFFEEKIKPELETMDDLRLQFQTDSIDGFKRRDIEPEVERWYSYQTVTLELPDSNGDEARIKHIMSSEIDSMCDVWKMDADEYAISFNVTLAADVEYYVDKSDGYGSESPEYEIEDWDWNEHVMLVSTSVDVEIPVGCIYSITERRITEIDYDG